MIIWPDHTGGVYHQTWWTEAHASWAEAIALVLIFVLELAVSRLQLEERREARYERRQLEISRQRSDVTCAGVTSILRSLPEVELCKHLWAGHFRHAGFALKRACMVSCRNICGANATRLKMK